MNPNTIEKNQCPVCLKTYRNSGYIHKHLFKNKRKCVAPDGHVPPVIDYVNEVINWPANSNQNSVSSPRPSSNLVSTEQSPVVQSSNTNTVTNRYTIAVDTEGNIVDLPNMTTNNDMLENNPALQKQVMHIIKNLNIKNNAEPKLPPKVKERQDEITKIVDDFGDVNAIINIGLKYGSLTEKTIVSINSDEDNNDIFIEKIDIPPELIKLTDRDQSFCEILYIGTYHVLTKLISNKYSFYELTRAKKAYEDCNKIMKYRKCALISYLVLKSRLDTLHQMNEFDRTRFLEMHEKYFNTICSSNPRYFQNANQFDNCMSYKMKLAKMSSIERQSLSQYYENVCHLINLYEINQIINEACQTVIEDNHAELNEGEVKIDPNGKYIVKENVRPFNATYPDYDFEVIGKRKFTHHTIKIIPAVFPNVDRKKPPVCHYYKRMYIDGCSDPPILEKDKNLIGL